MLRGISFHHCSTKPKKLFREITNRNYRDSSTLVHHSPLNMKFSFLALSLMAVTQAANLRSTKSSLPSSSSLLESEVILHGVTGRPSARDLDIIGQALVTSYNDANWELGHYMTDSVVGAPESLKQSCGGTCSDDDSKNDGLFVSVVTPIKQSCGGTCSDDDSASTILTKVVKQSCGGTCSDDDATDKQLLVTSFCQKIKSSGSTYLETVKDCSVVFVPLQAKHAKLTMTDSLPTATMEAHVILQGVLHEASEMDMTIIGKALVASYNDANWDTGFLMSDVIAPFQAGIPQPNMGQSCGGTCRDDDRAAMKGNKGLFVTLTAPIKQSCGGTCRDDDASAATLKQSCGGTCSDDDSEARNMMEASFCDKIKSGVSTNLASANMCAIVLVAK